MDEDKQLARDLALAYAAIKLQNAITNDNLKRSAAPSHIEELELLLNEFETAFDYYHRACGLRLDYQDDSSESS